jgi:hypothetical protein
VGAGELVGGIGFAGGDELAAQGLVEAVGPVEVQIGAGVAGLGAEAGAGQADAQGAGVAQAAEAERVSTAL